MELSRSFCARPKDVEYNVKQVEIESESLPSAPYYHLIAILNRIQTHQLINTAKTISNRKVRKVTNYIDLFSKRFAILIRSFSASETCGVGLCSHQKNTLIGICTQSIAMVSLNDSVRSFCGCVCVL